jgi:hypothetical protein
MYVHQYNNKLTYVSHKLQTEAFHSQLKFSHSINIQFYTQWEMSFVFHINLGKFLSRVANI